MRRFLVLLFVLAAAIPGRAFQDAAGVIVDEIAGESSAIKAGLRAGDILVDYDGKPLHSPAGLQAFEDNTFGKTAISLSVRRGSETVTLSVPRGTLGVQVRPSLAPSVVALYEEGRAALNARKYEDAVVPWTAAVQKLVEAGQTDAAAWVYSRLGQVRETQRMWKEGTAAYSAALQLVANSDDPAAQSRILAGLARCAQGANDIDSALRWHERAVQANTTANFESWVSDRLTDIGALHYNRQPAVAQEYFERALTIRERLNPDSIEVSNSLYNLGTVEWRRGDLASAENHLSRSIAIKERLGANPSDLASSLTNLANVFYARGDLAASHDHNSRALAIEERLAPKSARVANSLNNLANVATDRGDLREAQNLYQRSLAIRQELEPDSLRSADTLSNLGVVASTRGDYQAALDFHTRALAIRERLARDGLAVANSLTVLGNLARRRGDLTAAEDYQQRALAIHERHSPDSLSVAFSLNNLGLVARDRKKPAEAKQFFDRALALKERLAPDTLTVAETLDNIGGLFAERGDLTNALDHYTRVLTIRERVAPGSLGAATSVKNVAGIAYKQKRFTDAVALLTRAVDIVEGQRWQVVSADGRASLMSLHTESYSLLVRAYMALRRVPEAFAVAERGKARGLLDTLSEANVDIREGVDAALLEHERRLRGHLNASANRQRQVLAARHTDEQAAAVGKELDSLLVQYRDVQARIRAASPRYAALTQPQSLDLKDIQNRVLDADTVLLEYALGDDASYAFLVTKDSVDAFELPARTTIDLSARRVYDLLKARQSIVAETLDQRRRRIEKADAELEEAAARLSDLVVKPLAASMADKRLLIVADGMLQYVPFGALRVDGRPLVLEHEIVSLPSASVLSALRSDRRGRGPGQKTVAVVADPVFDSTDPRLRSTRSTPSADGTRAYASADEEKALRSAGVISERGSLSRLPFTRDEAEAIVSLVPPGEGVKATDFNASRATATGAALGNYRIVHLASHGLLNTDHPELSGIVLSLVDEQGQSQEGFLRLHEIYNLNWSADLVVLSACQTALGRDVKGEGLVGLTRGFMYGGAKSVVASLWNINDGATAEFMKRFYQGLLSRRLPAAAALRAAQVDMLKRKAWSSPYYWAAFVIQGDWK
jgi:CHAT domain-containing protein/Tfp pilus assembly protein PilF